MRVYFMALLLAGCETVSDPSLPEYWTARLSDDKVAEEAVRKLTELKSPKAIDPLTKKLQGTSKNDEKLRPSIVEALAATGDPKVVPTLVSAIDIDTTGKSEESARNQRRTNERALEALGTLKAKEGSDVVLNVFQKSHEGNERLAALRAMRKILDPKFTPALISVLETDDNMYNKRLAAEAAGEIGDPAFVPGLIWSMYFENGGSIYNQASFALFQIGPSASAALLETLEGKNMRVNELAAKKGFVEGAIEIKAVEVLGDLKAKEAEPAMIKLWDMKNVEVRPIARRSIAIAFASLGSLKATSLLAKNAGEPIAELRQYIVNALNELSDRSVLPTLLGVAKTGTADARKFAFTAYSRLGDSREANAAVAYVKSAPASEPDLVRIEAAKECGENVDCWIGKLSDKNAKVRDRAAYALGRAGDKKAAVPLLAAAKDDDLETRYAVYWALGRVGGKEQVPALEKLEEEEHGHLGTVRVNEYLRRLIVNLKRST
jgi:HEAT repeat protein